MLRVARSCAFQLGVTHDFENRGTERAGALNVFLPGGFEVKMPAIVDYFAKHDEANGSAESPPRPLTHGITTEAT